MFRKLICRIFGHKWGPTDFSDNFLILGIKCKRCRIHFDMDSPTKKQS